MLAVPEWKISMARVLIIGASKGIGLETTRQALEGGHQGRALARSAAGIGLSDPKLDKVRGDALVSKDIEAALNGIEVVIQTLGVSVGDLFRPVSLFSQSTRVLVSAMEKPGGEAADLRHRFWGRRQLCEHKLPAAGAVPTGFRPRL